MAMPPAPSADTQIAQVMLRLRYREMERQESRLPDLADVEFRCYSQNGEDGILLYLFALLGTTDRRVVEICAGAGTECNAANLIIYHAWRGLLIDGSPDNIAYGREFYAKCPTTFLSPPQMIAAWITEESVNDVVAGNGFGGEIDLLSLDIDGNDYWIWNALTVVHPRVVVLEFNTCCGPERSMTMAYDPSFRLDYASPPYKCGASLSAFVKLGRAKGYRLVGVQSLGFNAFFVRNDVGTTLLPEVSVRDVWERTASLRAWTPVQLDWMLDGTQSWVDV
jgi:hypothetical protein